MTNIVLTDSVRITYKELFTVKFIHTGYGILRHNSISDSMGLEPDEESKKLFQNYNIAYKFFNDTLACFIRTKSLSLSPPGPQAPYVKFTGGERIRFLINVTTDFFSFTDVTTAGAKQVYLFNNRTNAGTGGFICMHAAGVNADDLKNANVVKPDRNCFGVIEIFNTNAVNSNYELFDAITTQELKSPAFSITFISKI